MNKQASLDTEPAATLEIPESDQEPRAASSGSDPRNDWLCAWCLNRVASERYRFHLEGRSEFVFANPARVKFEIMTFSQTLGGRPAGVPTLEDTWFANHAWHYCLCDRCGSPLGWYYSGPHEFAGLIKPRLTRALYLMS